MSDDTMAVAFAGLNASIMTACVLTERGLLSDSDLAVIHDSIIEAAEELASPGFLNVMRERTDDSFARLKLEARKHGKGVTRP